MRRVESNGIGGIANTLLEHNGSMPDVLTKDVVVEVDDPEMWGSRYREYMGGSMGSGVAVGDYDQDGHVDIYVSLKTKAGKPLKQPFYIHPADGGVMAMAGLYEIWRDPTRDDDDPHRFRWTCTVLTTTAEDAVGHIHDRMPLLVEPERYGGWLDPTTDDPDVLRGLLVPAAPGRLEAFPVSTAVNNVRNNGPELVDPLPAEEAEVAEQSVAHGREEEDKP